MEKIIEQVQTWDLLAKLPKDLAKFTLIMDLEQCGTQYRIFTYQNEASHKSFSVLYDQATKEYFARVVIGLTEYFDANFIVGDIKSLEDLLVKRLKETLSNLAFFDREKLDSIVLDKKLLEWPYGKELPRNLLGFELFIRPDEPIRGINGSYIIIDYSDFKAESNLIIYYNMFRDEFFGETRIKRTPKMSAVFDANDLSALQEALAIHLDSVLQEMRMQLG
jgi:hypothetical protein